MVFWFVLVVAFIPICLWVLKRSGLATGAAPGAAALIKPVGQFNIGPGQRLLTVEVGEGEARTWLVLGVTAQQITTLHTMAPQPGVAPPQGMPGLQALPGGTAFAQLLRRAHKGTSGGAGGVDGGPHGGAA
jgi:flagellar protein FliO/FliZ